MPRPAPRPIRWGIVFEHVGFTYPGHAMPVLQDASFCIRLGECVALVGHNGAGKTTIVKLLLRLYDPTAGRILLDGVDLREYDVEDLRREMGVIFQDFVRYELTAGENIAMGQVEALGDRARLLAAAARGGARDLVEHLPQGLDTPLGRELGDHDLSGGEWQKLALARAFMRDSQVLVLDEPTAALDVQTEYDVYTRFHHLTRAHDALDQSPLPRGAPACCWWPRRPRWPATSRWRRAAASSPCCRSGSSSWWSMPSPTLPVTRSMPPDMFSYSPRCMR